MKKLKIFLLFFLLSSIFTCQTNNEKIQSPWPVTTLDKAGFDESRSNKLTGLIKNNTIKNIHSMLIIKNGKLVYEKYFNSFNRNELHPIYSVSKSVSSALIGIAIDKKFIQSVNIQLSSFFPQYKDVSWKNGKEKITLEHALCMTTGLEWIENIPYSDRKNSHNQMCRQKDWNKFVLERPLANKPGEKFVYNTGTSNLFALIIKNRTEMGIDQFADKFLFKPLGITRSRWYRNPDGIPCSGGTYGGLHLRPVDMAKIGYLFLKKGKWGNKTIISEDWINKSTTKQERVNFYGYQWWMDSAYPKGKMIFFYQAVGYGGQKIAVIPPLEMVVVITSGNYMGKDQALAHFQTSTIIKYHILNALK